MHHLCHLKIVNWLALSTEPRLSAHQPLAYVFGVSIDASKEQHDCVGLDACQRAELLLVFQALSVARWRLQALKQFGSLFRVSFGKASHEPSVGLGVEGL